jgi:hypothetical protein
LYRLRAAASASWTAQSFERVLDPYSFDPQVKRGSVIGQWAVCKGQRAPGAAAAGAQPVFDEERHVRLLVRDRENNSTSVR